jgi:hypothetical protein
MAHLPTNPEPVPETSWLVVRIILTLVFLSLFIFWRKRNAKMTFQAWSLFAATLNFSLLVNALPQIEIFPPTARLHMTLLFALNSIVAMWRLWQWSEEYVPKRRTRQIGKRKDGLRLLCGNFCKIILSRIVAFIETLRSGGNNEKDVQIVKDRITNNILT